jgi:hypothetical protein
MFLNAKQNNLHQIAKKLFEGKNQIKIAKKTCFEAKM